LTLQGDWRAASSSLKTDQLMPESDEEVSAGFTQALDDLMSKLAK
jgi:hypothetical protein